MKKQNYDMKMDFYICNSQINKKSQCKCVSDESEKTEKFFDEKTIQQMNEKEKQQPKANENTAQCQKHANKCDSKDVQKEEKPKQPIRPPPISFSRKPKGSTNKCKQSHCQTFIRNSLSEELFNELKNSKENIKIHSPPASMIPIQIGTDFCNVFIDLINEIVSTTDLNKFSYNDFVKFLESELNCQNQKTQEISSSFIYSKETQISELQQVKLVLDISDSILESELAFVLNAK